MYVEPTIRLSVSPPEEAAAVEARLDAAVETLAETVVTPAFAQSLRRAQASSKSVEDLREHFRAKRRQRAEALAEAVRIAH